MGIEPGAPEPWWGHIGATIGGETWGLKGNRATRNTRSEPLSMGSPPVSETAQAVLKPVRGSTHKVLFPRIEKVADVVFPLRGWRRQRASWEGF